MKSLFFDYGGTLDADGLAWRNRFYLLYKAAGLKVSKDNFNRAFYDADDNFSARHRLRGLDLEQTVRLHIADVLSTVAPRRTTLIDSLASRFVVDCRRQFSKIRRPLQRLGCRYRLGVISNFYGNLEGILRAEGLRDLFSIVADSGVLGVTKPAPEIFIHAVSALNVSPQDCVMIGDSPERDIAGAAALGMKTALVSAAAQRPRTGQNWTIRSVAELESVLS